MIIWKRAAVAAFTVGVVIAAILSGVIKAVSRADARGWACTVDLSTIMFPTQILLLPLAGAESFPHDLIFYLAAIIGNGVVYSLLAQTIAGLYIFARKILG